MDNLARQQLYRRAFNTEAGRTVMADIAARAGLHTSEFPHDENPLRLARREGMRSLALEIMALAGVEFEFSFPPLADEAARSKTIDTENSA